MYNFKKLNLKLKKIKDLILAQHIHFFFYVKAEYFTTHFKNSLNDQDKDNS